ncbi:MAG: thioredoxin domain-containing protein [bacterium]|nr:thioredoxin domain-containing protein [bacterium]
MALWPPRTPSPPATESSPPPVPRPSSLVPSVLPTDPVRGDVNAPLTIIEYGDFTCPSCVEAHRVLETLRAEYGSRLRIVWKDFPALNRITGSRRVHIATRCAQQQNKFWEYHDAALDEQPRGDDALLELAVRLGLNATPFTACLANEAPAALVDVYRTDAGYFNLRTAPTFFVNGTRLDGHPDADQFRSLLRMPSP